MLKIVWQYNDSVYDVVGETPDSYIIDIKGATYHINKEQCEIYEDGNQTKKEVIKSAFVKSEKKKHSHYHKDVSNLTAVDVYKVCELFEVKDDSGALHHAIKKLLCSGYRGVKDKKQDVQEAVDTLNRWLEMNEEK